MSFAKPTFRVQRGFCVEPNGKRTPLPPVIISLLDMRESKPGAGVDEVLYSILGSGASPVWVKVASLRPILTNAELLSDGSTASASML